MAKAHNIKLKNRLGLLGTLVFIGIALYACDKINNPIISKGNTIGVPTSGLTRVTSTNDDDLLKVLVEDFTGHLCTNCPAAGAQCEALVNSANGNQVVLLQNNVSSLAKAVVKGYYPSLPDTAYCNDFIALADSEWDNVFIDGTANGMPATMVDRLYFNGTPYSPNVYSKENVSVPFDSLIGTSQTAKIHIVDSMYAPPTSTLSMSITTTLIAPVVGVKYYLVVGLVEDSIYDWQDSVSHNIQYYLKRMTFRTAINDGGHGWGDTLSASTSPQTKHYAYANTAAFRYNGAVISVPPKVPARLWNMAHMYVIAFVYQVTGGQHNYLVLQAQKLHI
jgi:hypothetical protein